MKDEVSTQDEGTSLSKIFIELTKLEKNFRSQETLNKIKIEELNKSLSTNRILKDHLETAYAEIQTLRNNVQSFEVRHHELEVQCSKDKDVCEQIINKLTTKISQITNEHNLAMETQEMQWKQTKCELKKEYDAFIQQLQEKHGETLLNLEQEVEQERNHAKQLQSKLDFTLEDNLLLQDKLRKLQQEYLPLDAYKTQLKNLTTSNERLKTQCLHSKTEFQIMQNENTHLQKHNERLNQFVTKYNQQQTQIEAEKTEHEELLLKNQTLYNETKAKYSALQQQCDILKEENYKLLQNIEVYKGDYCNVDMHRFISEQNKILQELVKAMRKERMKCTGDQLQNNLDETEERIIRLEELIHELKKCAMSTRKHCIRKKLNGSCEPTGTLPMLREINS